MEKPYKDARRIVYGNKNEVTVKGDDEYLNKVRDSLYKVCKRRVNKLVTTKKVKGELRVWISNKN